MRLHRIRVEHVRGLDAAEVHFARSGATVVEAPNESGKTTLFDAFDLLLREKHSASKQIVKDLQPAGRDVGSTVEAELTVGGTHLTIRKCFNKDRATELSIHAPSPRQLTGNEAHDELRRLLEAGTDLALFEALRFHQGRDLDSVTLGDSEHLARQLDASAGGSGDTGDDALYERILAQFQRYFTPTGKPGKVLTDAETAVTGAEARVTELATTARELDGAARRAAELQSERQRLTRALAELGPELEHHHKHLEEIAALRTELLTASSNRQALAAEHRQAVATAATRDQLIAVIASTQERLGEQHTAASRAEVRWQVQSDRLDELTAALTGAEDQETTARAALKRAQLHADLLRHRESLQAARDRQRRVEQALTAASEADAFLADDPLADDRLDIIRRGAETLRLAEARLGDAAPTVHVTALDDLALHVDGDAVDLAAGRSMDRSVPGRLQIRIGTSVEVEVRSGSSLSERQAERDRAAHALREACSSASVTTPAEAEELEATRQLHLAALRERDVTLERELGEERRGDLDDRIRRLTIQVADLEARLAADGSQLELVTDDPGASLADLEAEEQRARDAAAESRADRAGLAGEVGRLRDLATHAAAELDASRRELAGASERLESERGLQPDDAVRAAVETTHAALVTAEAHLTDVQGQFDALQPEEIELLAASAEQRRERLERDLDACREETAAVLALIAVRGGNGVGEQLQAAEAERDRLREARRSLSARAQAARTLKEAFEVARDEAYAAYREPLRQRIVAAGRLVFGDDLDVELDERLAVITRTLAGVTLPFDRLSAGAREQLAILTALAAADLAGEDGVPLVLDDTLGYTDAGRLERLGAVLGRVRGPQVVVLTCVSERFASVGGAVVVRLRDVASLG